MKYWYVLSHISSQSLANIKTQTTGNQSNNGYLIYYIQYKIFILTRHLHWHKLGFTGFINYSLVIVNYKYYFSVTID